jgi:hypothetical protein
MHEFTSFTIVLYLLLSLIPGVVSTGIIFAFTNMRTHFLHHIHPHTPFPGHLPHLTGASPNLWIGLILPSCSLILYKKKEKRGNENHYILSCFR